MWEGAFRALFALWGEEGRRAPSAEASHAICFSLIGGRGGALPLWEDREVFTGLSRRSGERERARVRNPLAIQYRLWSCECRCGRHEYSAAHCTCKPSSETPRVTCGGSKNSKMKVQLSIRRSNLIMTKTKQMRNKGQTKGAQPLGGVGGLKGH